jgi:hypothetical protein
MPAIQDLQHAQGFVTVEETARLEKHLHNRLGRRVRHLRVQTREGGLVLQGRANTYHIKQLAQHALMHATRLPLVANEIEVV